MSAGLKLDIRFAEVVEGGKPVGYVTIKLQGEQVVKSFSPPDQGMAFIEGYVRTICQAAEGQRLLKSRKKLRHTGVGDTFPEACDDNQYGPSAL